MKGLETLERFRIDVTDHVATLTIAAPPVNSQDRKFREEIIRIFDVLGAETDVRAIVLTGDGKIFSAGADLSERPALLQEPGGYSRHNRLVRASFDCVMECPKPVIAAVNGAATEVDYGLAGGVRHVLRSFSPSDARLMIYTARRMSGAELYRMNVASVCVPRERVVAEAQAIGKTIAEKVPLAVVAAKRSFGLTEELPLRDGYRYEQSQTAALAETEDTKEALAAFREKRKPVFKGQ